ncbi:hypothetical protein [Ornithinibacillus bavariensis]|uniref:Uncharacterized protein n=1 Tax=Ornithinibacillus bavariensis TaxID=545502 RepID=A0A919X7B4_9BACI|nr:hypothetical protein [Ornithinibacillus bavariensis]GIO27094.1 hypothetical protein J43TS3_17050 [Ornithinibacillus bavariensis]HAM80163.1 hypothetical protein [Ornithinibacillus sp.]
MIKRIIKKTGIAFLGLALGLALGLVLTTPVWAGTSTSPTGYYSAYGHNYSNYSGITTGSTSGRLYANAWTRAQTNPITNEVPAGYLGARARMYNSSGTLVASTSFIYSSTKTNILNSDFASYTPTKGSSYYSQGATQAYNGNGYTTYTTFASPSQTAQ